MGNRVFKRFLAMCLAMVLTVASSMAVMAAEPSPGGGDVVPDPVIPTRTTFVITKSNSIELSYTQKNAVKYRIQYKSYNGTWDHCRTITTTDLQKTIANLMRGGRYDIRVCGINEKGKAGEYCAEASRFIRSCSAKVSAKSGGFNVKVSKANAETTGYKIYWTRDASFKRFNVMTVSGASLNKTIAGKKGQTYYVRVVPVSVANGKTYAGVQNSTHSVKIK
jgi:hypothetical protein